MTEFLANFHFLRPLWLLAALPVLPAVWLLYRRLQSGKAWSSVIAEQLLPHLLAGGRGGDVKHWPLMVLLSGWLIAVIALAGPSWERLPQPVERREDALVVLYDLSRSMLATDIAPSRLVRSRQKLLDLLETRTEGTTALVAYAGDAHVVSPLTDDLRTIANLMPALSPGIMPLQGSRPGPAVEQAVRLLRDSGLEHGQILLVTDGIHSGDSDEIDTALAGTAYRLSVLGVGTEDGSPIPSAEGFLRDSDGTIVIAGLARQPLKRLAGRHGGHYSDLELGDQDIERILSTDPWNQESTQELLGRGVDTWQDRGYWLALLLVPVALGAFRRGWVLCLLVLPLAEPAQAQVWQDYFLNRDQRGQQLLQAGDPQAAAETFADPDWTAAANYRAGNYQQALEHYRQDDSADSWYNRGNSLARSGALEEAIAAYDKALEKSPGMEDAAFNKALLEQLLEQQEQQNQQQQQDQKDQQQQDQQQSQQQQQDQQQQDAQQSQGQDEQNRPQDQQQADADQDRQEQQAREQQQAQQQPRQPHERADQEKDEGEDEQQTAQARDPEEQEREMANEQWLRRIPDDPSGLLRRKFEYESRRRAQEQPRRTNEEARW